MRKNAFPILKNSSCFVGFFKYWSLKIDLNLVLPWAGAVLSLFPASNQMFLPSFSIRCPVVIKFKTSAGISTKRATERSPRSCHLACSACWALQARLRGHPSLPVMLLCVLPCSHLGSGVVMWAVAAHSAPHIPQWHCEVLARVTPQSYNPSAYQWEEGTRSLLEPQVLVCSPWHARVACKEIFFHFSQPQQK